MARMYLTLAVVQVLLTSLVAQVDWVTTAHSTTHSTISMEARVSQILNQESLLRLELERKIHALETKVESLQSTSQDDRKTIANLTASLASTSMKAEQCAKKEPSISFLAHISQYTYNHHGPVVFDSINQNIGNAYNKNNGIFTAPLAGVYSFAVSISGRMGDVHGYIMLNGQNTGYLYADDVRSDRYQRASLSLSLYCNRGDKVWFDWEDIGGQILHGGYSSWFSGHLVHVDQ